MTLKRPQIIVLAVLLVLVAGSLASSTADAGKASNALRAKALRKQLRQQNLNPVHTICIPDDRADGEIFSYRCSWQASGHWAGAIPYRCFGKAEFVVETKLWTIDPCNNKISARIPLAPKPLARPLFGFNEDWVDHLDKLSELKKIGGGVARQSLSWRGVEAQPGVFNWAPIDKIYRKMLQAGIRPLWVASSAPCWAQANPSSCDAGHNEVHPSSAHYGDYADFVAAAAARYPNSVGIELWNEPNFAPYWGGAPDPDAFSQLLKTVAQRMASSPMPIISGGLSPHGHGVSNPTSMDQSMFLARMFEDGAAQQMDGIGTHPYPSTKKPGRIVDQVRARLGDLRQTMEAFGAADTPLWITEVGVSTSGPDGLSSKEQGKALAKIYDMLRRVRQIPVVLFHRFEAGPKSAGDGEPGFGVLDSKGHRKPAFCAVAHALGKHCG